MMALLSHREYRQHATAAFRYVRGKMVVGAANRFTDQPEGVSYWKRSECVDLVRWRTESLTDSTGAMEMGRTRRELAAKWGEDWRSVITREELDDATALTNMRIARRTIEINTYYALQFGCGNCEEQSSMVFRFLKERKVMPLDWMEEEGILGTGFGNHAFVILGRDKKTDASKIGTWNAEVVWCDPYEGKLGGLSLIKSRFGDASLRLLHRFDDFSTPPTK